MPAGGAIWPGLLAFEMRYQGWRVTFLATVVLLALLPVTTVATRFGPPADAVNGAFVVTETMALFSLLSVFALPMLCVHAALRDDEHGMRALIESRPVSRTTVLAVRYAGVVILLLAALAVSTIVLAVLPLVIPLPADRLVPFSPDPYWRAFAWVVIPNALWCSALLFAVAAASRSTLATFVASIGIYAGYMVTALMVDSPLMAGTRPPTPELLARAALLDPFGLSAFFEQTRYLMPLDRQARALSLSGHLLQNRLMVLAMAALCLVPLLRLDRRMARAVGAPQRRWFSRTKADADTSAVAPVPPQSTSHVKMPVVDVTGLGAWRAAANAVMRLEARLLLRSWPLLALLAMWIPVIAIEADGQLKSGDYGTRVLASTAQLADAVPIALRLLGALCVLYFGADVFSRERLLKFDGIRDATPVRSTALLAGKLVALMTVPLVLALTGYGTTVVMHLFAGGLPIEWDVLAAHVAASMLPLVILVGLAAALQVLIGNRWVAMLLGLAVLIIAEQGESLGMAVGLEHPLWRFGSAPSLIWSDLAGYGNTLVSWLAYQGTWLLGTLVLLGVAAALWPRGEVLPFLQRMRRAPQLIKQGLAPRARTTLLAGGVLYAAVLAGMTWQTTVHTPFERSHEALARRVAYERTYRHLSGAPQPAFTHVAMHVKLLPTQARADVHARLHLVNNTDASIDSLWLVFPTDLSNVVVGPAVDADVVPLVEPLSPDLTERATRNTMKLARVDALHAVHVLVLSAPLAPGDSLPLSMMATIDRGGIRVDGNAIDVSANGTFLHSSDVLPRLGYSPGRELRDSTERIKQGLEQSATPVLQSASAEDSLRTQVEAHGQTPAWFTADVRIETDADQVAQGPGALIDSARTTTHSTWHYRTTRPTSGAMAISSGRYDVQRATVQTVRGATPVEVWYNPRHAEPASRLLTIATSSLEVLEREFGPYPHDVLRIIEVQSGFRFGAYALPGSIYLTETRGMLTDARSTDVDLLLRRIGHEVAHQWWGHAVNPLDTEGRLLLVETMAKYAEQVLLEQAHGQDRLTDMLAFDHDRYLNARSTTEATLLTMSDEPELYYRKGTLAMHALRHTLGDSVVRGILRNLLATQSGPRGTASAQQLHRLLRAAATTPTAQQAVDEWLTDRVIYDLAVDTTVAASFSAASGSNASGTHLTARFTAQRVAVRGAGAAAREVIEPADALPIILGLRDRAGVLHQVNVMAQRGVVSLDTTVSWLVQSVEIDPLMYLIDRDRSNNRVNNAGMNLTRTSRP
ncbi:peptidase M1 family protein [Gemmatimonas aurantiaca T-27]|uniref:Peptidase M1 family protein n=1 Tax=Gemmatimonas aurantiaca (strain DSM 14586 / JCM 11422 / NBRC 100505 / T-27) TaxID=379066 RepID=C1A4Y1_GEMAT|nr:peptidase M1 family protein [Gemmatimonas aurantiaca T-27]